MRRALPLSIVLLALAACGGVARVASGGAHGATVAPIRCHMFPRSNPINQNISKLPVNPRSRQYIDSIGAGGHLRFYLGVAPDQGIPYTVVGPHQRRVPIQFTAYGDQSDPGPYPIPPGAPVERNSDRHVLVLQNGTCRLYELFDAHRAGAGWDAASGAVFNLRSNALRPDTWTSADAAGLPILPLLVRYDEVARGHIDHALRVTVDGTQSGFIHPATHFSDDNRNPALPPMGLRLRLKASFDISRYSGAARVILAALRTYGMFVADDGPSWFVSGAPDPRWNEANLQTLKTVPASAFEAVATGPIRH